MKTIEKILLRRSITLLIHIIDTIIIFELFEILKIKRTPTEYSAGTTECANTQQRIKMFLTKAIKVKEIVTIMKQTLIATWFQNQKIQ